MLIILLISRYVICVHCLCKYKSQKVKSNTLFNYSLIYVIIITIIIISVNFFLLHRPDSILRVRFPVLTYQNNTSANGIVVSRSPQRPNNSQVLTSVDMMTYLQLWPNR